MDSVYDDVMVQTLFYVAWGDGEIQDDEREFLLNVLSQYQAPQHTEQLAKYTFWMLNAPPEPNWSEIQASGAQELLLRSAMTLACSDRVIKFEELTILDKLRKALGFNEADFAKIQLDIEKAFTQQDNE